MLTTDRSSNDPDADPDAAVATGTGAPRTASGGGRRLLAHHLLLGLVLAAVLPLAGTGSVWSADEGALLYQAVAVAEGRGWTFAHPFPEVDPDGSWFPIHLAGHAADGGYIVLGKHATFVRLTGALHRVGGYPAVLGLSVTAGLAAAAAAAALARRLDRRAAVPALWLTGVASPLFLSSYVAWAHTLAAALVGWSLVGLTADGRVGRSTEPGAGRPIGHGHGHGHGAGPAPARLSTSTTAAHLVGALALAGSILVRTEALLAGVAVTLALAWAPFHVRRRPDSAAPSPVRNSAAPLLVGDVVPAVAAGVATGVGFVVDRVTAVGRVGPVRSPGDRWGGLPGRLEALAHTWLRPDFSRDPRHLLLLISAALVIGAGIAARRRRPDHPLVTTVLAAAVAALALRFVLAPTALIPGLAVAFPLLFAGLALVRRSDLRAGSAGPLAPTLLLAVGLFWAAVAATQYRHGGGGEWGGRYFALGLPAAVAVAATTMVRAAEPITGAARRRLVMLVAALALLPVTMGILGLADARVRTEALVERVDDSLVEPGDGGAGPVVLSSLAPMGRWAWEDVDRSRWLLVTAEEVADAGARLREAGVTRFVLVTGEATTDLAELAPWYRPIEPIPPDGGPTVSLDRVVIPVQAAG